MHSIRSFTPVFLYGHDPGTNDWNMLHILRVAFHTIFGWAAKNSCHIPCFSSTAQTHRPTRFRAWGGALIHWMARRNKPWQTATLSRVPRAFPLMTGSIASLKWGSAVIFPRAE
jgi:hypothetical protein